MARPESAADEAYAALAAEFISAVVAGASARLGTPLRPETSNTSSSLPPSALSRPDTGLLREETALAIESALEGAFSNLQQFGLISDGKPMAEDKAMALLAGLIEVRIGKGEGQTRGGRSDPDLIQCVRTSEWWPPHEN